MKRYLIWILVSAGFHGGLFWGWSVGLQPVELPLQAGDEAVSIQLVNVSERPAESELEPSNDVESQVAPDNTSLIKQAHKVGPDPKNKVNPETAIKTKSMQAVTASEVAPAASLALAEPVQMAEPKSQEQTTEKQKSLDSELQKQPLDSAARVTTTLSEGVILQANLQSSQKPNYPQPAIIRNQQGKVTVRLWVDQNGRVQNAELMKSSGYRLLDKSVLRFVQKEKFVPASHNGLPVASAQEFSFRFVLQ